MKMIIRTNAMPMTERGHTEYPWHVQRIRWCYSNYSSHSFGLGNKWSSSMHEFKWRSLSWSELSARGAYSDERINVY